MGDDLETALAICISVCVWCWVVLTVDYNECNIHLTGAPNKPPFISRRNN